MIKEEVKALASAKPFAPAIVPPEEIELSENSRQVLKKRYLRRGIDGRPIEDIEAMFRRVAHAVAEPDGEHGYEVQSTEDSFYALLSSLRFFPNSPTFTGAGTPLGQLAACFVLPISDDMGRDSAGIFQTLRDAALIQQTGGGNGFSFSNLRPKGDAVKSSAGVATGPVGFLRVYDIAFGEVAQGGTRRGANMAVLRVDHPDIEEFVTCKAQEGQITNFNISVGITDEFMRAVEADEDFELRNPRDGAVWRTVRARDLFHKIVTYAHHNGEPGVLFLDAANRQNPVPHLYQLAATNPCGEQFLGPYENCCLGSINLAQHITDGRRSGLGEAAREHGRLHPLPGQRRGRQQVRPGRAAAPRGRAARPPHRSRHHGPRRHDVPARRPVRIGRRPGVRGSSHGIRALPLHEDKRRDGARARAVPCHQGQHLRPTGSEVGGAAAAQAVPARLGPARPELGRDRHRDQAIRHPERGPDHRRAHGHDWHGRRLRGIRLRACLRPGIYANCQGRRTRPQADLHQPALRAGAHRGRDRYGRPGSHQRAGEPPGQLPGCS